MSNSGAKPRTGTKPVAEHTSKVFWLGSQLLKVPYTKDGPSSMPGLDCGFKRGHLLKGGFELRTVKGERLREFSDFLFL